MAVGEEDKRHKAVFVSAVGLRFQILAELISLHSAHCITQYNTIQYNTPLDKELVSPVSCLSSPAPCTTYNIICITKYMIHNANK